MLVHKGGQINNVQFITGLRIAEMSLLQNCSVMCTKNGSYCEKEKKAGGGRGQGRCERRSEAFVKIHFFFFEGGGGRVRGGGQGGCELRSEAFVNIQKQLFFFGGGGVGSGGRGESSWGPRGGGGQGECEWRSEAFV